MGSCYTRRGRHMLCADADSSLCSPSCMSQFELALGWGTLASVKAFLDLGKPYVSVNTATSSDSRVASLLYLARAFARLPLNQDTSAKIFLILDRGADVVAGNYIGKTCLHLILSFDTDVLRSEFDAYDEEKFKDILMCMVTAGADVYASDNMGRTVSQTACGYGHEEFWREVLVQCGYDPDEVFCLEEDFNFIARRLFGPEDFSFILGTVSCKTLEKFPGMGISSIIPLHMPWAQLYFKEYSQQRKILDYICPERYRVGFWGAGDEQDGFWEAVLDSSNSEDEYWYLPGATRKNKRAGFTSYPPLLHDGVHWQTAFS